MLFAYLYYVLFTIKYIEDIITAFDLSLESFLTREQAVCCVHSLSNSLAAHKLFHVGIFLFIASMG